MIARTFFILFFGFPRSERRGGIMVFPVRKNLRLSHYDYSQNGYYFVTICCPNMSFGNIKDAQMQLNCKGEIARDLWLEIPVRYPAVVIDQFVIMPDHIHGIVIIKKPVGANTVRPKIVGPTIDFPSLSRIIQMYKGAVAKTIHQKIDPGFKWQRSFHDRIIRNEKELDRLREYVRNNPRQQDLNDEDLK